MADGKTRPEPPGGAPEPSSRVGQRLGRFEIRDVLGVGGMGTVFDAYDTTLDRAIALKLLHPDPASGSERRLLREAKAMAQLSHPNVVNIFEAGVLEQRAFIAMELVRGQTLAQWQEQPRPWRACVEVYLQAGRGLEAAHAQGLMHRDFKPSNCILDHHGTVRVLDFGLAKPLDPDHRIGRSSYSLDPASGRAVPIAGATREPRSAPGTLGYMPLEQLWGQELSEQSDQFSFCVSLFEAIYGQRPFSGPSVDGLVSAMSDGHVEVPPDAPDVPRRLLPILRRGLRALPADRWPSMSALLLELQRLRPKSSRRRWGAMLGVAGLVAASAWWVNRPPPCPREPAALDGAWSPERQTALAAALTAALAPESTPSILASLDGHAQRWLDAHQALCEAERKGRVEPAERATRAQCLDEAREDLRDLVSLMLEAEPEVVEVAAAWARRRRDPSDCEQVERFMPRRRMPAGPRVEPERLAAARELQRAVMRARAQLTAGDSDAALRVVEPAIERARALELHPQLAELQLLRGNAWVNQGHYELASHELERAYAKAVELDHDPLALELASALTYLVGDLLDRHDAGLKWGLTAEAMARQPWVEAELRVSASEMLGNIYYEQGRYDEALSRYRESFEQRQANDPEDAMLSLTAANIGLVLFEKGSDEEALPVLLDVLDWRRQQHGATHPSVANSLLTLGMLLHRHGRHQEAMARYQHALDISERSLGDRHPGVALVLTALGRLWMDLGDAGRALAAFERALSITTEALGPHHSHVADAWLGLGRVLASHYQLDAAQRHAERGEQILSRSLGARHVQVGNALVQLAEIEGLRGARRSAREHLELAVDILREASARPTDLARAQFALARLRWSFPGEHATALELARRAQQTYASGGELHRTESDEIEAWLARATTTPAP